MPKLLLTKVYKITSKVYGKVQEAMKPKLAYQDNSPKGGGRNMSS